MKLNYDFYTFSPKHYRELSYILTEYPEVYKTWSEYFVYVVLPLLALLGKVSIKSVRNNKNEVIYFVKFWPKERFIPMFRKFDKRKLVDKKFKF